MAPYFHADLVIFIYFTVSVPLSGVSQFSKRIISIMLVIKTHRNLCTFRTVCVYWVYMRKAGYDHKRLLRLYYAVLHVINVYWYSATSCN